MPRTIFALLCAFMAASAPAAQPEASRQFFLFLFRPGPAWVEGKPMAQQDLRVHGAFHAALVRDNRAFAGGGYVGKDGGMAIVRAVDLAEVQAILAADPAIINGVFVADVRQWRPRFHNDKPLIEAPR